MRIHYLQSGRADAPHTLLLIPGWRISASIWSKQLSYFSEHQYHVIAIDSRSQGSSDVVQTGNAPENRAADIQQVISELHLTHVILIGWSQGAQDVAAYVNRFGTSAVEGLALIDSPVSAGPNDVTENPEFVKIILQGIASYAKDPRGYSDRMMHAIISTPTARETYAQLDDASLKTPTDIGISMLVQDLFTTDRRPTLKKFDKPTLVVASGKSPLLDAQRRMAVALPEGQFVAVDNAAHAVFFDQPDEFNHRLAAFVASIAASKDARTP
ncbi:alpha/beta fold hydrolase [Dyella lipolytica]|uniref:Alpha/beta hydrolase n=1 Tax=Dyella lipolytica TaxID=1867835 RepID=A0ABW8IYW3_9GAMM|nr:alpha/beta hydrolase [Dyella lipolytica]